MSEVAAKHSSTGNCVRLLCEPIDFSGSRSSQRIDPSHIVLSLGKTDCVLVKFYSVLENHDVLLLPVGRAKQRISCLVAKPVVTSKFAEGSAVRWIRQAIEYQDVETKVWAAATYLPIKYLKFT